MLKVEDIKVYEKKSRWTIRPTRSGRSPVRFREFGWRLPVLVDKDTVLIAGHGRLLAAPMAGVTEVPAIRHSDLTPEQADAYRIADNRLAEMASWNNKKLTGELTRLRDKGVNIEVTGFSMQELARRLPSRDTSDVVVEPPEDPVTEPGQVWVMGDHRLICGDSTDPLVVARLLSGEQPHMMVTDPPYGVDYDPAWRGRQGLNRKGIARGRVENDGRSDWSEAYDLFPGAVAYVWMGALHPPNISLEAAGFEIRAMIVWVKSGSVISQGHYHWRHESCWFGVRDGFAAEISPAFCDVAVQRWEAHSGGTAVIEKGAPVG